MVQDGLYAYSVPQVNSKMILVVICARYRIVSILLKITLAVRNISMVNPEPGIVGAMPLNYVLPQDKQRAHIAHCKLPRTWHSKLRLKQEVQLLQLYIVFIIPAVLYWLDSMFLSSTRLVSPLPLEDVWEAYSRI